jgi:hypothetical protein
VIKSRLGACGSGARRAGAPRELRYGSRAPAPSCSEGSAPSLDRGRRQAGWIERRSLETPTHFIVASPGFGSLSAPPRFPDALARTKGKSCCERIFNERVVQRGYLHRPRPGLSWRDCAPPRSPIRREGYGMAPHP